MREAYEASDRRIRRAKTRVVAIDLFVCKERRRVEWRVSVVRRRKVGSSASRSRLGPGFHAPIRRRRRPTTRVADAFAVSHRAIGASPAPPEAVPRGNRKHGFFSRREESLENARPMKDTGETTELKRTVVFHREKTVARKGNERRAPWSGRRGTPPLPSAARSRGASVATPSSRWVSSAETAASCANSGGFWVNIRSVRAVRRHRGRARNARNRDAKNEQRGASVQR